jgi:hypothetical protein
VPEATLGEWLGGERVHVCGRAAGELGMARIDDTACDLPAAEWIGRLGAARLRERGPDDLAALEPVYLRAPDAQLPARPPDWRRPA